MGDIVLKKIIIGGLVGAVLVYPVSFIWHMTTGLAEIGIKNLPDESILTTMHASIHEPGFYFFPYMDNSKHQSKEQMAAAQAAYLVAYKRGPTGILIYTPGGTDLEFGKMLTYQFLFGVVAALLIAWILALTAGSTTFATRALIVLLISILSGVVYDLPYWNWYGFPLDYTIAHMAGWIVSWGVAGLGMAAIVKR